LNLCNTSTEEEKKQTNKHSLKLALSWDDPVACDVKNHKNHQNARLSTLFIRTYSIIHMIHMYYITTVSCHIFILQSCEVKDKNVNPSEFFQPFGSLSQRQPPVVSKSQIFPARQNQEILPPCL